MKLTGKCKEEFENWLFKKSIWKSWFYTLIPSMQYGVCVDFFDSVKYEGKSLFSEIFEMYYKNKTEDFTHNDIVINSLEKANEIYNLNQ